MTRDHPRVDVVAAADAVTDHHVDGLALVEFRGRLGRRADAQQGKGRTSKEYLGNTHYSHSPEKPISTRERVEEFAICRSRQRPRVSGRVPLRSLSFGKGSEARRPLQLVDPVEAHVLDDAVAHHDDA